MIFNTIVIASVLITSALACAEHNYHSVGRKRAGETNGITWDYDLSHDWGRLSPEFATCQHGTMQAPIPLRVDQGLAYNHLPNFAGYDINAAGTMSNWGFGPALTYAHAEGNFTSLPSFSFEENGKDESVFLTGWHIHAPSDHTVDGVHSKAEMHLVHVETAGTPRAVLSIRIAPGNSASAWFSQMPPPISFRDVNKTVEASMSPMMAVKEVANFSEFWTYQGEPSRLPHDLVASADRKGSLTTPPCNEGLRFFVARQVLYTSVDQMRRILDASKFSSRQIQEVWQHQINV
jgi:carbonic anhydrase